MLVAFGRTQVLKRTASWFTAQNAKASPRLAEGLFLTSNDDNFDTGYTVPGGHERPQGLQGFKALKGLNGLQSFEAEGATRA